MSGKVALWSKHFTNIILVPMFYSKLCNHIYRYMHIYIYIYICRIVNKTTTTTTITVFLVPRVVVVVVMKKVVSAVSIDTLRGGRKGHPQR